MSVYGQFVLVVTAVLVYWWCENTDNTMGNLIDKLSGIVSRDTREDGSRDEGSDAGTAGGRDTGKDSEVIGHEYTARGIDEAEPWKSDLAYDLDISNRMEPGMRSGMADGGMQVEIRGRELSDLSEGDLSVICSRLWDLDVNGCEPGTDFVLDLQGFVKTARQLSDRDWADRALFTWLDESRVFNRPTYKAFHALLDNYEMEAGVAELVTDEEERENTDFIDLVTETPVMTAVYRLLVKLGRAPADVLAFKHTLYDIWFRLYRRSREDSVLDSCGFEHVFVGESRGSSIIGFHNWLQFYLQEKRGNIDYRGHFRRGTTKEESPRIITLQFTWKKTSGKPIGSSFIGTSPEFEMALYTLMYMLGREKSFIQIKDYPVEIVCYRLGRGIGSAFPVSRCD